MAHGRRTASPAAFCAFLFFALTELLAATLVPNTAWALPVMTAETTSGAAPNGASCTITDNANLTPSFLPQTSSELCTATFGTLSAFAVASFGSVGASAIAVMQPCTSNADCGGSISGRAEYIDQSGIFTGLNGAIGTATVTFNNLTFSGSATGDLHGGAEIEADAVVDGKLAARCDHSFPIAGPDGCTFFSITVPVNTKVSLDLDLFAEAGANAAFNQTTVTASANASHTFSLPVGSKVFDLPDGITFNDPDAFVFDNIYLPPDAVAAVPEPASVLMWAIGLTGLGVLRRRRPLAGRTSRQSDRFIADNYLAPPCGGQPPSGLAGDGGLIR